MRLGNIEIFRGLAALWVVGFHAEGFLESRGYALPFGSFFQIGGAGVDLFFVISGFVIALSLLNSQRGAMDFAVARLIRIVPAYWTITLLTSLIAAVALANGLKSDAFEGLSPEWFIASLFFTSQPIFELQPIVYQGWTLEYEMLFYAAVAIALFTLKTRWLALILTILLVASAILLFDWVTAVALEFIFGVLAAFVFRYLRLHALIGWLFFCLGIAAVAAVQILFPYLEREWGFGLPFTLLVMGAASIKQVNTPKAIALGRDSYAVYLVQVLTIPLIGQALFLTGFLGTAPVFSFVFMLLVTQICGTLFETKFDGPLRAWLLSRWNRRMDRKHAS